ncbi:MAG: TolC family protein, partial [Verrucomicrobiae bacterium]|nr:TolC family protein [Verrucomicrobiae bacterium]MCP5521479.1 TolC family protein [Verrucomicrobiales bacterium]
MKTTLPGILLPAVAGLLAGLLSAVAQPGASDPKTSYTLEQAITTALTNNPSARVAGHRLRAARALVEQADSALWPRLQFETSYMGTDNPMMVFGSILNQRAFSPTLDFNDVPEVDNLDVRGIVTVPLYTGGLISANRRAARAGTEAARADADAVRQTLAFEVARTFHTVLKTREFIRAAEAGVTAFEANLAIANKRLAAGTLLRAEVLDVEVRLAQAREDLVRARNANDLTQRVLINLLGVELPDITVVETTETPAEPAEGAGAVRPELTAMAQRTSAAAATVRAASSGYLPRLGLFGSAQYDYGFKTEGDGGSWSAGALVQWDLWDGKLTHGRVQEAKANLATAEEESRRVRLGIDLEVQQARLRLNEARERLAVSAAAVSQAEESVQLTRARFEQGLAIATQLIDAETSLTGARVRRAEAQADARIAIAALRKALGLPQLETTPAAN